MQNQQVSQIWQWNKDKGHAFLTCELLSNWQHGFFTKEFYPHLPEDLTSILRSQTKAFRVKQVHGNKILTPQEINIAISEKNLANPFPDADAVISDSVKQSVWVASADCTPILIGDRQTGRVCAIHAGWRGTSLEIAKKAIARFLEFGSNPENLRVAIGPAIAGKIYQVDEPVAIKVGRTIIFDENSKSDPEILQQLQTIPNSPLLDDKLPGKVLLNVPRINQIQLEQLGINSEHIAIAPFCTYQQQDLFFSYRRTGEKQVQWSGIVSLN